MFRLKYIISTTLVLILLVITSIIKNQTRILEKKLNKLNIEINLKEQDINESQLDFYFLTSFIMSQVKPTIKKEEVYKNWNFIVSAYDFTIPNWERAGKVLNLIELKTIKKKWSEDIKSYYDQNQYITIAEEQLIDLLKTVKM